MYPHEIAAAIIRVAFLPESEWSEDDWICLMREDERPAERKPLTRPESWLLKGRALAWLARIMEKLLTHGETAYVVMPSDEEALAFSTSK